jgi:hypothetical protein
LRQHAAEAGVRLGAVLTATAKIAFSNLADFVECDEDGNVKVNEDGQLQLRSDLAREDLEAISTSSESGVLPGKADRGMAMKVSIQAQDEDEAFNSGKWSHWLTTRFHAVVRRTCWSLVPHTDTGRPDEILPL